MRLMKDWIHACFSFVLSGMDSYWSFIESESTDRFMKDRSSICQASPIAWPIWFNTRSKVESRHDCKVAIFNHTPVVFQRSLELVWTRQQMKGEETDINHAFISFPVFFTFWFLIETGKENLSISPAFLLSFCPLSQALAGDQRKLIVERIWKLLESEIENPFQSASNPSCTSAILTSYLVCQTFFFLRDNNISVRQDMSECWKVISF